MIRYCELRASYWCLLVLTLAVLILVPSLYAARSTTDRVQNSTPNLVDPAYIQNVVLPAKQAGRMTLEMRQSLERYQAAQSAFVRHIPGRDRGGGPDDGGYTWMDSEEDGGPAYEWIDISEIGEQLRAGDDWNSGAIDLGWTFNFYGTDYNSITVCSNGWVSFTSQQTWFTDADYPNGNQAFGAILAAQTFDLDVNDGGALRFYTNRDERYAVISWDDIPQYGQGGGNRSTFQIIIYGDGMIKFQYGDDNDPTGENVVVGIQNAEGLFEGDYEAGLHIISNDPENGDVEVNVHMFVTGAPDIGVEWAEEAGFPREINFNDAYLDVFNGGSYDVPITIANEGTAELSVEGIDFRQCRLYRR